jgi:hypothetical protein
MTKAQRHEYRENLAARETHDLQMLRAFLRDNGFPEDRDEKLAITEEVLRGRAQAV